MSAFAFLTGKIRVLENNLLNQMDIDRMVDAPDFNNAFKALNDTDYGSHLLDVEPHLFQEALDNDFLEVKQLITSWINDDGLLEFMFLKYDAHNVKLYLKAKQQENADNKIDDYTLPIGLSDPSMVKKIIINEQKDATVHETTKRLITDTLDKLSDNPNGFEIDSTVDRILLNILNERTEKISSSIIKELYRMQKDTIWLKTFLRARRMGLELQEIQEILPARFSQYYELEDEETVSRLPLNSKLHSAYKKYMEHKQLWQLEKDFEEAELEVIRQAKYEIDGPIPIVGYFYAKQNAIRNIRLILTGKMNEIEAAEIKKRVRELY